MHTSKLGAIWYHAAALVWFHAAALVWFSGPLFYMIYKVSSNPKPVLHMSGTRLGWFRDWENSAAALC